MSKYQEAFNEANIDNDDTNELCSSTEKSAEKEVC